ncbi:hypothetical protein RJT34_16129 [Clitoria ternatea]|uniref:Glycosyltransferase n=1 Tax=Clitoria ternatea TaxID=43366 RepID=A0AAN9J853_CLITE
MEKKTTRIVIVPSPGFSHLLSILEFSKRLIQHSNGLHVTCLIPTVESPPESSKAIVQTLPSTIQSTFLPSVHFNDDTPMASQVQMTMTQSLPFIREALKDLTSTSNLVAMAADLFASDALICAKELNMLSFVYFPTSAMTVSFCFYLPKLDQEVSTIDYKDHPEPIHFPGCVPVHGRDLPNPVQDRTGQFYEFFLERCKRLGSADGVIVNSFAGFEAAPITALTEEASGYPSLYPVGPIIQSGSDDITKNGYDCLRWLDKQEASSVLYVSFGSGGTLSREQLNELAFGFEQSGKKFLWVVRAPSEIAHSAYLHFGNDDPLRFLPDGFIERTKEQGLVVPSWAPQVEILGHSATGGFLSHCGWNSILESVMNGVPIIAWPLFAEQRMNAAMLTDGLRVAIRPNGNENGLVERGEVEKVVRRLMEAQEGTEIGRRMQTLKSAAAETLQQDGSSSKILNQFAGRLMGN